MKPLWPKNEHATQRLTHVLIVGSAFAVLFATLIFTNLESLIGASAAPRSHGAAKLSRLVALIAGV